VEYVCVCMCVFVACVYYLECNYFVSGEFGVCVWDV